MLSSIRINPAWEQAVQQHLTKMNQIAAKGAGDRARIWSNTPSTNTVLELPSGYASVWSSGDGEYILSIDEPEL